jgi:hypothetical protein
LLEFVANTLREHMGTDAVRLFPLSCTLGLAAKASGDTPAYARSGLKALEEALGRFLSDEKSATLPPSRAGSTRLWTGCGTRSAHEQSRSKCASKPPSQANGPPKRARQH